MGKMILDQNFSEALSDIKEKGWGFISQYSNPDKCELIKNTLDYPTLPINLNQPYPTYQGGTKFNNNVLTVSREAFEVVTNNQLIELASCFVNGEVILKCIRTYSIAKKYPLFEWHADNVHPVTFEADESLGINCILYLEDDYTDEVNSRLNDQIQSDEESISDPKQKKRYRTNLASKRPIQRAKEPLDIEPLDDQNLVADNQKSENFEIDDPW